MHLEVLKGQLGYLQTTQSPMEGSTVNWGPTHIVSSIDVLNDVNYNHVSPHYKIFFTSNYICQVTHHTMPEY